MSAVTEQEFLFTPPAREVATNAIDVHAVSMPARTFTGDFWFTNRENDRLWFALGDVAGKGLPAALVMAMIQEELEQRMTSCARAGCDPATTVARLHAFLRPLLPRNRFATAVMGWLRDDGVLKIVNAGHCPPLVVRADGTIESIGSTGPVVGLLTSPRWSATTRTLGRGDRLVLYSDGVVEAMSPDGAEFGEERVEELLDAPFESSREVANAIIEAVSDHAKGETADDTTVLVIGR